MTQTPRPAGYLSLSLVSWGWDESFAESFKALGLPGEEPGRVLRADLGACLVALDGREERLPVSRALRPAGSGQPTAGDWVVVHEGEITGVLERRTAVVRASTERDRHSQVLAANVEFVLVVEPLGERWRPRRIERLMVVAWQSGALPIVVLTKADRTEHPAAFVRAAQLLAPGALVHAVSVEDGRGLEALASELTPRTTAVVLGRSGAGKSTLANFLAGGDAGLATGEVRADGKGRHTTVARELVRLANGAHLIDTPGLRAIGLADSIEAVGEAFSDIESLASRCRFNDCAHETEPGCAVSAAVESGALSADRLESYNKLLREHARLEARADRRLQALQSAELRARHRQLRRMPKRWARVVRPPAGMEV